MRRLVWWSCLVSLIPAASAARAGTFVRFGVVRTGPGGLLVPPSVYFGPGVGPPLAPLRPYGYGPYRRVTFIYAGPPTVVVPPPVVVVPDDDDGEVIVERPPV